MNQVLAVMRHDGEKARAYARTHAGKHVYVEKHARPCYP